MEHCLLFWLIMRWFWQLCLNKCTIAGVAMLNEFNLTKILDLDKS